MRKKFVLLLAVVPVLFAAGCGSAADTVSKNISKESEQFRIERRVLVYNGITDKVVFLAEGRCSYEDYESRLEVTCKNGPNAYAKNVFGLSDNVTYSVTQIGTANVSEYHTKIILRPTSIAPDFDLVTGEQG
jgi:hypothetical protein